MAQENDPQVHAGGECCWPDRQEVIAVVVHEGSGNKDVDPSYQLNYDVWDSVRGQLAALELAT